MSCGSCERGFCGFVSRNPRRAMVMSVNAVLTPETTSRVALAQAVADADRDVAALQSRIQNATALNLSPSDRRAVVAQLRDELAAVEARRTDARDAVRKSVV